MFRKLFFAGLFIFSFQLLNAQDFHAGLIGGISTTQVAGDNLEGFNKAGLIGGGFVNRSMSEDISLQMEIIFIQKGSRKPIQPDNDNSFYVMRLSYFEVPVLVKWQALKKLNIEAGPSVGVLIFSEEETEAGILNAPPFKKMEFSGNIGASYPLTEKLTVNTRYSQSLLPIRPFPGYVTDFFHSGQYNTVLAFTLQYRF